MSVEQSQNPRNPDLEGLEGLHEFLQLVGREEIPDEMFPSAHLRQLLRPLWKNGKTAGSGRAPGD